MKHTLLFAAAIASMALVVTKAVEPKPSAAPSADAQVHSIELPHYLPYLPPGPDRELFASRCLACHTSRYMTMQPPMTEPKWEDSVKKMIKTYGAPIHEDEAPRLAAYLVTLQHAEPDPLARTIASSDKLPELTGGDVEHGKQVFATACAACHGPAGKGDGPNAAVLLPRPFDLTTGTIAPAAIEAAVVRGVRGTAMPSFASMPPADLASVVAYTQQLGSKETATFADNPTGKAMYDTACAACHGATGRGDGLNAPVLPRTPTNFHLHQPSADRAAAVLAEGVPGTSMPSWKAKFDDAQRKSLADYVRSMYGQP